MSRQVPRTPLQSVEKALEKILDDIRPLDSETVPLLESLGRVLDEDIVADVNVPPFRTSAMDGYAVRSENLARAAKNNQVGLKLAGKMMAGDSPMVNIEPETCVYVATGAAIPGAADAVVKVEETAEEGGIIFFSDPTQAGRHLRQIGEDVALGETVISKGTIINPGCVGMMAGCGKTSVKVIRRPVVAILSTGSELVEPDRMPGPGKIRNTNAYSTWALIRKYGGVPRYLGIAPDDEDKTRELILKGLRGADMLLTSGGVSVGERDFVKDVITSLGEIGFWGVAVKPGKPFMFGTAGKCKIFGLPGFPTSSMVSFEVFVRPAILKMQGILNHERLVLRAELRGSKALEGSKRRQYIRARISCEDGKWFAEPAEIQRSAALKSMVSANGFIIVPENYSSLNPGDEADIVLFDLSL